MVLLQRLQIPPEVSPISRTLRCCRRQLSWIMATLAVPISASIFVLLAPSIFCAAPRLFIQTCRCCTRFGKKKRVKKQCQLSQFHIISHFTYLYIDTGPSPADPPSGDNWRTVHEPRHRIPWQSTEPQLYAWKDSVLPGSSWRGEPVDCSTHLSFSSTAKLRWKAGCNSSKWLAKNTFLFIWGSLYYFPTFKTHNPQPNHPNPNLLAP